MTETLKGTCCIYIRPFLPPLPSNMYYTLFLYLCVSRYNVTYLIKFLGYYISFMQLIIFKEDNLRYHYSNMFYTWGTITSFCYMFDFILWNPQLPLKGADTANPNLRSFYFFFLDSKCLHTHINVKGAMQIEQVEISG